MWSESCIIPMVKGWSTLSATTLSVKALIIDQNERLIMQVGKVCQMKSSFSNDILGVWDRHKHLLLLLASERSERDTIRGNTI